ncbi:uncharacterized protein FOMMEDRAFT_157359 [Fomitiporia mediterranea MF3/22]|uniref:uncharacterized protein n=1 Tax=Fomitiporia mediterranea (strain MF3/22) TaxID=694068 RepID=UPI00044084B3|nr:uncharacterized protein FOMMEDRAFT_157359 [Fomitiporia mediterranea MF3/22]EJD02162.1 hypothetical protein FOMMEDRAFT_157359 [Fomitiporia mediterranea MF3/22]
MQMRNSHEYRRMKIAQPTYTRGVHVSSQAAWACINPIRVTEHISPQCDAGPEAKRTAHGFVPDDRGVGVLAMRRLCVKTALRTKRDVPETANLGKRGAVSASRLAVVQSQAIAKVSEFWGSEFTSPSRRIIEKIGSLMPKAEHLAVLSWSAQNTIMFLGRKIHPSLRTAGKDGLLAMNAEHHELCPIARRRSYRKERKIGNATDFHCARKVEPMIEYITGGRMLKVHWGIRVLTVHFSHPRLD